MANTLPPGAKLLFRLHKVVYRASGGRIGHRLTPKLRCLLLTTRLWSVMNTIYKGYDSYQRATKRRIPVIVVEPDE